MRLSSWPIVLLTVIAIPITALAEERSEPQAEEGARQPQSAAGGAKERFTLRGNARVNAIIGVGIVQGSALALGVQGGYAPWKGKSIYFGPEISALRYSSGTVFQTLLGGWYETKVHGSPRLSVAFGAFSGLGFAQGVGNLPSAGLSFFLDGCLSQDIDDLVSVRAQFRPGVLGGYFAFMMNFNIVFKI